MAEGSTIHLTPKVRGMGRFRVGKALARLPLGHRLGLRVAVWALRGIHVDVLIDGKRTGMSTRPRVWAEEGCVYVAYEGEEPGAPYAWLN